MQSTPTLSQNIVTYFTNRHSVARQCKLL